MLGSHHGGALCKTHYKEVGHEKTFREVTLGRPLRCVLGKEGKNGKTVFRQPADGVDGAGSMWALRVLR